MAEIMTPFELISGMQTIKNNQLVSQMNQRKMQQADEEQQRTNALRSLYQQTGGDSTKLREGLINQGFGDQIPEFDKQQRDASQEQRLTDKARLEDGLVKTSTVAQIMSPIVGQQATPEVMQRYKQLKAQAEGIIGKPLSSWPEEYDQQIVAQGYQQGMTVAQQLAQQYKAYDIQKDQEQMSFNKQKFGQQSILEAAKLAETARSHDMSSANQQWYQAPGPNGPVWKQGKQEGADVYSQTIAPKPMTEVQGKANIFAQRAEAANSAMTPLEDKINVTGLSAKQGLGSGLLGAAGNMLMSPEQQKVEQSQRDFVNAVLRLESGAAISPTEFDSARKQYFPAVGDSPEVIKQKRENRVLAIKGIKEMAGPNAPANKAMPKQQTNLNFSGMTEEEISAFKQAHGLQ